MRNKLLIEQLEAKLKPFGTAQSIAVPPTGWLKAVRTALGISLQQVANRLSVSKPSVRSLEQREQKGTVTLNSLREAARALDMELVYGLVPKDGSLDKLIERKAQEMAMEIVKRTSVTMKLEDQGNSEERLRKAIEERTRELKEQIPKSLWD